MKTFGRSGLVMLTCMLLAACSSVNQSVEVGDDTTIEGSLSNVNGAIRIGERSTVTGSVANVNGAIVVGTDTRVGEVRNVNGSINLSSGASAQSIETVNGALRIGAGVHIAGSVSSVNGAIEAAGETVIGNAVSSVNGPIRLNDGVVVTGKASSVNGAIRLQRSRAGSIETRRGTIEILDGSVVEGSLRIPPRNGSDRGVVRVVIGVDSRIGGPLVFEREVALFVHESAEIGDVSGAEIQRFSGDPPRP